MESIHLALIACRFFHDAAAMFLWGAFGFLATLVPPQPAAATVRRLAGARLAAIVVVFVTMAVTLPFETAMIGGGWPNAMAPQMLGAVLAGTSIGQAWLADAVASLLLLAALAVPVAFRSAAVAVTAGLVLASLVLTGHAMIHEGLLGYLQQANDLIHVLASGAWVGALVPLALILRTPDAAADGGYERILRRFSAAGRIAVALTVLSGLANTFLIVGHWPVNPAAPYQMLLCAKIALVIGMIGLASMNQSRFVPRLRRKPLAASAAIRRGAWGEVVLGLGAITLVSILGMLDPGR